MKYLNLEHIDALMRKHSKADEYIVHGVEDDSCNIRFHKNTINREFINKKECKLEITSFFGKKQAKVVVSSISEEEILKGISLSEEMALIAPEDPHYVSQLDRSDYSSVGRKLTNDYSLTEMLEALKNTFSKMISLKSDSYGSLKVIQRARFLINNMNIKTSFDSSHFNYNITVKSGGATGWAQKNAKYFDDLNIDSVNEIAVRKASAAKNPVDYSPGKYTVILEAPALAELMNFMYPFLIEKNVDLGISPFSGKINTTICNKDLSLISSIDERYNFVPWSDEGIAARNIDIIKSGVLKDLCRNRFYAIKKNREPVFFGNFILLGDMEKERSLENIIQETDLGILVTRFWYTRIVNPATFLLTGMTRDGLYEVKEGKISRAIKNFRYNDSLLNVLNNIDIYSSSENAFEFNGFQIACPNVRVRDFNFTSGTEF